MTSPKLVRSLKDRLAEALVLRHMKPIDLSRESGISRGAISQYLAGKVKPKQDKVVAMAGILRVSPGWLTGLNVPIENVDLAQDASENVEYARARKIQRDYVRERNVRRRTTVSMEVSLPEREMIEDFRLLPPSVQMIFAQLVEFYAYPELATQPYLRQRSKAELKELMEQQRGLLVDEPDDYDASGLCSDDDAESP